MKERTCKRCGCTATRGCAGGCVWVPYADVCDRCLTDEETGLWLLAEELSNDTRALEQLLQRLELKNRSLRNLLCLMLSKPAPRKKRKGG